MKKICIIALSLLINTSIVYTRAGIIKTTAISNKVYNNEIYNCSLSIMHNDLENEIKEVMPIRGHLFTKVKTTKGLECGEASVYIQDIKDIAKKEGIALFCSPKWASEANAKDIQIAFVEIAAILKNNLINQDQFNHAFFNEKIKHIIDQFMSKLEDKTDSIGDA